MMRRGDTLFARLFGIFVAAIVLGHLIGFLWFRAYGPPPPPPPKHPSSLVLLEESELRQPSPLGGPLMPLLLQLLLLLAAAWFGARLLTRPIRQLSAAAERLSENIDSAPLAEGGPQEVRKAARSFNRMQARIREQIAQRSRILTAVSHDLRTPLARIKLRVEELEDGHLRTRMSHDLGEMTAMLDATLAYLREQRTSETQHLFDLQSLVESLVENAQDNGAAVSVVGACRPLHTQPQALRSCLNNLLDNALRYAGHARIELHESEGQVDVRVIDNGPGIPAEQREAVFEPFFRLESSRNRNSGGVGLGLSIAREAALRLGGELLLEDSPGGGLSAVLRLPRR
ncbi:MAG: two-component sensor histidine kinase [Pseudomonas kuykendallii]|uniref:histidine kinase n=2 Tax=Pseudomonas kuykendallii TaxID=1007099 RepID=A0A2W5F2W5_9PSED|nr:ATP-binding protein [Pseudomonas kuykendallii]PZP24019.1 MAG: two-component sensor histidine kinase [Pseudomonas kuykendallii]